MSGELGDCLLHVEHHQLTAECYLAASAQFARYIVERGLNLEQARAMYAIDYEHAALMQAWTLGF